MADRPVPGAAPTGANGETPALAYQSIRSLFAYLALVAGLVPVTPNSEILGAPLVLIAVLAGWRDLRLVSRVLLLLIAVSALLAWLWAPQVLSAAAANAARLTALVVAVMLLSATLGTSRDLSALAASLFAGRPLPRYLSLTFATGFLAVPLNFGSVGVMSTMIGRMVALRGDSALTRNAARAVLRGFALASICSPLSVAVVITLTFLSELQLWQLLGVSMPFALGYMLLGGAFREREGRHADLPETAAETLTDADAGTPPVQAWLRFAAYIGAICAAAYLLSEFGGMPYSRAVALAYVSAVAVSLLARRTQRLPARVPTMAHISNELAVMSGSAFLGVVASGAGLHLMGQGFGLPAWAYPLVAFAVPSVLFAGGMAGLNPIVTGTFVGAMLAPIWPSSALLGLGLGMLSGWGITVAGTPYSAASLLVSRLTGYSAQTAALRWNLAHSMWALLSAGLLAAALTHVFGHG
jgi:hypothetical protein